MSTYFVDYRLIFDYFNFKDGTCLVTAENENNAYKEAEKHLYETKTNCSYFRIKKIYQPKQ